MTRSYHHRIHRAGLVDTSVWIDFLVGRPSAKPTQLRLTTLLQEDQVLGHPSVVGELACGNLRNRSSILGLLQRLPSSKLTSDKEVLALIEGESLFGRGLGWIDLHLIAAARLSDSRLWSLDKFLAKEASRIGVRPY